MLDEARMHSKTLFELTDVLLREFQSSETRLPPRFGGLNIVFLGDYTQPLPVLPGFYQEPDTRRNVRGVYTNILNKLRQKSRNNFV